MRHEGRGVYWEIPISRQAFPQKHGLAVGKAKQVGEHPKPGTIAQDCAMSDLWLNAWYSPSPLTIPFMTPFMRTIMSWYNAESFSNPSFRRVVAYLCFGGIARRLSEK